MNAAFVQCTFTNFQQITIPYRIDWKLQNIILFPPLQRV